MTMFIPSFFLVVNTGQRRTSSLGVDRLPRGPGLRGVPDSDHAAPGGVVRHGRAVPGRGDRGRYFDKLRAIPIPRTRIVLGRLVAEGCEGDVLASVIVLIALRSGSRSRAAWPASSCCPADRVVGSVYAASAAHRAEDRARRRRTRAGCLLPLLFLTAELRPADCDRADGGRRDIEPGTYLMEALRSLILTDLDGRRSCPGSP